MSTRQQDDTFDGHIARLGADGVASALGFNGAPDPEALAAAFAQLTQQDAAQALLKLDMTRY